MLSALQESNALLLEVTLIFSHCCAGDALLPESPRLRVPRDAPYLTPLNAWSAACAAEGLYQQKVDSGHLMILNWLFGGKFPGAWSQKSN
jgi:hypothetical protein